MADSFRRQTFSTMRTDEASGNIIVKIDDDSVTLEFTVMQAIDFAAGLDKMIERAQKLVEAKLAARVVGKPVP
jgi:hypothetical protein